MVTNSELADISILARHLYKYLMNIKQTVKEKKNGNTKLFRIRLNTH